VCNILKYHSVWNISHFEEDISYIVIHCCNIILLLHVYRRPTCSTVHCMCQYRHMYMYMYSTCTCTGTYMYIHCTCTCRPTCTCVHWIYVLIMYIGIHCTVHAQTCHNPSYIIMLVLFLCVYFILLKLRAQKYNDSYNVFLQADPFKVKFYVPGFGTVFYIEQMCAFWMSLSDETSL
jgi:hypothetical protein